MASNRDDFGIAIRYALLQKGAKQKFSLFFLICLSILIFFLDSFSNKFMNGTRAIINDGIYRVSAISTSPFKFFKNMTMGTKNIFLIHKENKILKDELSKLRSQNFETEFLTNENKRMYRHLVVLNESKRQIRVWYPNGNIRNANSIRMGLHDFGEQPHAIKQAFSELKVFERQTLNAKKNPIDNRIWENYFKSIYNQLHMIPDLSKFFKNNESALPITWVTEFLYRPLLFVGVGLSDAEIGIWWLLCQRQRIFARILKKNRPSTRILVKRGEREAFWQSRPFGVEPIFCDDWDEGWDQIDVLYEGKKAW